MKSDLHNLLLLEASILECQPEAVKEKEKKKRKEKMQARQQSNSHSVNESVGGGDSSVVSRD